MSVGSEGGKHFLKFQFLLPAVLPILMFYTFAVPAGEYSPGEVFKRGDLYVFAVAVVLALIGPVWSTRKSDRADPGLLLLITVCLGLAFTAIWAILSPQVEWAESAARYRAPIAGWGGLIALFLTAVNGYVIYRLQARYIEEIGDVA